jgi:hypothetical protein
MDKRADSCLWLIRQQMHRLAIEGTINQLMLACSTASVNGAISCPAGSTPAFQFCQPDLEAFGVLAIQRQHYRVKDAGMRRTRLANQKSFVPAVSARYH